VSRNKAPIARASEDQTVGRGPGCSNRDVTLDGGSSTDPDGDALTYSWDQTAGKKVDLSTDGATARFTPPSPKPNETITLTFELTVDGGHGETDTDEVNIDVEYCVG
jgi:Bacterial Ig domain